MRIFRACTGAFVCLLVAIACLAAPAVRAEAEAPDGSYSEASDKVGLGIFSRFPIRVSTSVEGGYDDNVNTTPSGQQGSGFVNATLVLRMEVGTPRTNVNLSSNFGFNYFFASVDNQFEPNINLKLEVTHKASARLQFDLTSFFAYQTEPNFQAGLGTNRRSGNYFLTQNSLAVAYVWLPRVSTRTSYGLTGVKYDNSDVGVFEDRIDQIFGNELRFLIWPTTNLVAEYRFQVVSYGHEGEVIIPAIPAMAGMPRIPAVRLERDSTTQFILAGVDHVFNPRLSASFRGGAEFRDYDNGGTSDSPHFEATVAYKLGKDTGVNWNATYGIEEGNVAQNPSRKSFHTGLVGAHNLTSRVTANLGVYYYHDDYSSFQCGPTTSPAFTEDSLDFNLSLRYALNRYLGVQAGYSHTEVSSGEAFRDYSRNRVWAGLSASF
jgi:Putative beta-barrel porin 2